MYAKPTSKTLTMSICFLFLVVLSSAFLLTTLPTAQAATVPLNVVEAEGTSHPITDITTMTPTIGSGGYKNQGATLFGGVYQGVSILDLCNSIGNTLASYQNVTVATSGGSGTTITFNYNQVAGGINLAPQYNTYSNTSGALQAPIQPVTLIIAYQFANGSALPGIGPTRLLIVGPEGLLFQGPGLAGVENITITNVGPVPTLTPTPTAAPTPTPVPIATPTPTHAPTNAPTATPTQQPTATPAPTASSSPTPNGTGSSEWTATYTIFLVVLAFVIIAVAVILRRRKLTLF